MSCLAQMLNGSRDGCALMVVVVVDVVWDLQGNSVMKGHIGSGPRLSYY
jgi:hypothetical protein